MNIGELLMRRSIGILATSLFACFVSVAPVSAGPELAARIEEVINGPAYRQARWGILVVDAHTGQTLYERDAGRLFLPASTTKLYSCAAALADLGPEHRFETPVFRRGKVSDGRLEGDLILVAQGDLTLGGRTTADGRMAFKDHDHIYASFLPETELTDTDPLAGLKALAKQVAAAGIRQVAGDVLVDDRLFAKGRGSGSGPDLLTPMVVNDNVVDILVTPADVVGQPARLRQRPETRYIEVDSHVETVAPGQAAEIDIRAADRHRLSVRGKIALKARPALRIHPVDDPALFARALLMEALTAAGVTVAADPRQPPRGMLPEKAAYEPDARLARYTSPPLSELIKVTLKVSHNLYASTLPLLAAAHHGKESLADGLRLQRQFLAGLGVEVETISFAGGAGGANADAVTPRATVQLLQGLAKRSDYGVFRDALPVLGVDGTLVDAVGPESPARGKVRAKTGTLTWHDLMNDRSLLRSKALAGTLTTATGRELFVVLMVNDVPLPKGVLASREGKVLGRLCEIIYQQVQ
jgi:D-alanyl-D-alanine carboxypeptidase/D-alanyl-D-alanine-endopeptidase (penicillin-binding protein 4)